MYLAVNNVMVVTDMFNYIIEVYSSNFPKSIIITVAIIGFIIFVLKTL